MGKKRANSEIFILDCSVAGAWCFHDEAEPYAEAIAARLPEAQAVVPPIWPLEIANALLMGERRKRSTAADTTHWLRFLGALPIQVDDEPTSHTWGDVLNLARAQKLSAYDAAYLELALRRKLPLATLDGRLNDAAVAIGVAKYNP